WLVRAALREDAVLRVAPGLERDDARHVALKRQHLKIEEQLHVLGERIRYAGGRCRHLARLAASVVRLDRLNPPFDLPNVAQVPIEPGPIAGAELTPHLRDLGRNPIEDAATRG